MIHIGIIQFSCLERNNQDQSKCQSQIDNLVKCCMKLEEIGKQSICCGEDIRAKFPKKTDIVSNEKIQRLIPDSERGGTANQYKKNYT